MPLLYRVVSAIKTEIMTALLIPTTRNGTQHRLIKYLLTFNIMWEGNHVEQMMSEYVTVAEFWCRKNKAWGFTKFV